jgi:hypothetical protein
MAAKLYVNNGSWRTIKVLAVNESGTWRYIRNAWVKDGGTWRLFYGGNEGNSTVITTPGTYSFTVPDGIYSITCTGCGGGGGGGSGDGGANNDGPGYGGGAANLISQTFSVTPGQILNVVVGASGTVGFGQRGGAGFPTMVAGNGVGFFAAGGGGGASWNGWGPVGQISPAYTNIITGLSVAAVEDTVYRGGLGVNGGGNGGRPTAGNSNNGGSNGGTGGPYNRQAGSRGQGGKLTIAY